MIGPEGRNQRSLHQGLADSGIETVRIKGLRPDGSAEPARGSSNGTASMSPFRPVSAS